MIVPVTISSSALDGGLPSGLAQISHDQVVLIELQGELVVEPNPALQPGMFVGKLSLEKENKPTLLIGHHLLEGKLVPLPKPLGIMQKKSNKAGNEEDDEEGMTEWVIGAIVRKKIVFGTRPTPVNLLPRKAGVHLG